MNKIKGVIIDQALAEMERLPAEIEWDAGKIFFRFKGYGDCSTIDGGWHSSIGGCGIPVMIEKWNGELRVVVWNDINKEGPTHIISLEGAKENKRKSNHNKNMESQDDN